MQHATERVERPGESQEALDGKKESVNTEEICCDSPTSEPESHMVLCCHAATHKLRLRTADITNAYFQAAPMTRLLRAPPRGGLTMFDAEIQEDAVLMCRVPVMERKMLDEVFIRRWTPRFWHEALWLHRFAQWCAFFSARTNILPLWCVHVWMTCSSPTRIKARKLWMPSSTAFRLGRSKKDRSATADAAFLRMKIARFTWMSVTTHGTWNQPQLGKTEKRMIPWLRRNWLLSGVW